MAWFSTLDLESLNRLFVHKIKCLYDVETRLIDALPKMSAAATDPELKAAFDEHLQETREQLMRLEQVFQRLGADVDRATDSGMKGIITGGEEIIAASGDDAVRDAGLIAAGQAVEHHEIALYGTARTWARYLGLDDVADLLQRSLDEEGSADRKLTALAESGVNAAADR
jgi:ferritin-like metal-binding protein YciE